MAASFSVERHFASPGVLTRGTQDTHLSGSDAGSRVAVLIPALNPGSALVPLVQSLLARGVAHVAVIDDGSDPAYSTVFANLEQEPRCTVLRHGVNRGKGQALKTGLAWLDAQFGGDTSFTGVVTADADGQHLPEDIMRVASMMVERPGHLILGARAFGGAVPLRSALGNNLTRGVVRAIAGAPLSDTQTGLRGIPAGLLDWLTKVPGDRYEYEMNVLVESWQRAVPILEQQVTTVYLDGNRSSHFRPLWDSMSIYAVLLRFVVSSAAASVVDMLIFALLFRPPDGYLPALVGARAISSVLYLYLKKEVVFRSPQSALSLLPRYYAVTVGMGALSFGLIHVSQVLGWGSVLAAKVTIECLLFWASFVIQRDFVFYRRRRNT